MAIYTKDVFSRVSKVVVEDSYLFFYSRVDHRDLHSFPTRRSSDLGGLKKYLPITYWTFLIGALAIAGVPALSGFFSKDEILFKTFTSAETPAHTLLWGIGIVTSLLTATYMFRLVFLTFHGERRHDAPAAAHAEEEHVDLPPDHLRQGFGESAETLRAKAKGGSHADAHAHGHAAP